MSSLTISGLCQLVILLLSVEISTVSCDTFYIVTSPSSPCPGEYIGVPCLTLQQYASNPSRSQNITFLVEPGIYNLSTVLTVSDGYNFTMSSSDVTVTCISATAKFEFNRVENVHISGVTFQGCTSGAVIQMSTVTRATITNSSFTQNEGNCLQASHSTVTVNESRFFHNGRAHFYRGHSGRAISASYAKVSIYKSIFKNNVANADFETGGALGASNSNITIDNSEFSHNSAVDRGGAIAMSGKIELQIINTTLYGNVAESGGGGAIFVYSQDSNKFEIQDTVFYGNRASSQGGGAIYINNQNGNLKFQMNSTVLNGNSGGSGGAMSIFVDSSTSQSGSFLVQINNSVVYDNSAAAGQGGGVYIWENIYYQNYSTYFEMHNVTAYSNIANKGDGGAMLIRTASSKVSINLCQFVNNTASQGRGGAIALYESSQRQSNTNSSIVMECQFVNNTASVQGGAIYKNGRNTTMVTYQSTYHNNMANVSGGAIYINGTNGSVSVTESTFIENRAIREGGGAIYSNGRYANVTLTSSTFHKNSASYCSVLDVDNYNHFSVNLTNSIFTYNTASGQTIGGGVACIRNASIYIIDSTFRHNFANHHAGVFYLDESHTTVNGSLFINNSAALDGGVFYTYVHASDYIIRRSQFSENMARGSGGVMLIGRLNCYASIDETIFDFNSAGDRGGVVAIIASSMFMEINRTNIYNNTAQFGGVISACNSQVTLMGDSLIITADPLIPFCKLYDENVPLFNITALQNPGTIAATESTEPPSSTRETTTTVFSSSSIPTSEQTDTASRTTSNMAPKTTYSDAVTIATTGSLGQEIDRSSAAGVQSTTTEVVYNNKNYVAIEDKMDKKIVVNSTLSATALVMSLIAVLISVIAVCTRKKGSTLSKIKKFSKTPSHNSRNGSSLINNPNSSDEEGDGEAL